MKKQIQTDEQKESARIAARKWYYNNKEKAKEKHQQWASLNKTYILDKQREEKRKRKLWAIEYLGKTCALCNLEHHPAVYEFHHTDPETKDRDPSKMMSLSLQRLQTELDKCVLLCANCHRLLHHGNNY